MELLSYLSREIERKIQIHTEEIETLNSLIEVIERKENFAKVWFTLVKCGITDVDFIKDLVSSYFNIDKETINVASDYAKFKIDDISVSLYVGNSKFSPNIVQNGLFSKFYVKIEVPNNWSKLIEEKRDFKKSEYYEFCEEYIELCKRNAPLSEKLALRYEGMPKYRQYWNYILIGRKRDKKLNRDIDYYQRYIDNENEIYSNYCDSWKKSKADALNEFLIFYNEGYSILQKNLDSFYCNIQYNINFNDIVEKLKKLGEII